MALVDLICYTCGYQEIDHFIGLGLIPKGWFPPDCPKCFIQMARSDKGPMFNLKSADLPHGFGSSYQPAFKKYCGSKREAMSALKDMNTRLKEDADRDGTTFSEYEWTPEPEPIMRDMLKLRKEEGPEAVDREFKKQAEYTHDQRFSKELDEGLQQMSNELGA